MVDLFPLQQAGYFSSRKVTEEDLEKVAGRGWENLHQ
jgi:hypothetical protein